MCTSLKNKYGIQRLSGFKKRFQLVSTQLNYKPSFKIYSLLNTIFRLNISVQKMFFLISCKLKRNNHLIFKETLSFTF